VRTDVGMLHESTAGFRWDRTVGAEAPNNASAELCGITRHPEGSQYAAKSKWHPGTLGGSDCRQMEMASLGGDPPGHFGKGVARRVCRVFPEKNGENGGLLATSTHPLGFGREGPPAFPRDRHPATKNRVLAGRVSWVFPEEFEQNHPSPPHY
jgi:hypothetical protein